PRAWSDRNPEADLRLKSARAALTELSERVSIPLENLLTPDTLRRLAWSPPEPLTVEAIADALQSHGARPWQVDYTAQLIWQAFVDAPQKAAEAPESPS